MPDGVSEETRVANQQISINESEDYTMKPYNVRAVFQYQRMVTVQAKSEEEALEKMKMVVCETDPIRFEEDDLISCDIAIEGKDKEEVQQQERYICEEACQECIFECPVCGGCLCEGEE